MDDGSLVEELELLANTDPGAAAIRAKTLADEARDLGERSRWQRIEGLALALLGRLDAARPVLAGALEASDPDTTVQILTTLGGIVALQGDPEGGLDLLERAVAGGHGQLRARAIGQRGSVLNRIGRRGEAMAAFDEAIAALDGDHFQRVLFMNRGILRIEAGSAVAGLEDLERAANLAREFGQRSALAEATHNVGWARHLLGDLPGALEAFDEAESMFQSLGYPLGEAYRDRADALADAGLMAEAVAYSRRSVAELEEAGAEAARAESLVVQARIEALTGAFGSAHEAAAEASRLFHDQDRLGWAASAELMMREARRRSGVPHQPDDLAALERLIIELDRIGLVDEASSARLLTGRIAFDLGMTERAVTVLDEVEAGLRTPAIVRHALACSLSARARGDVAGAVAAADRGLAALDEWRTTVSTVEMRAGVSLHASELASIGIRHAVGSADAVGLFDWIERDRGGSLRSGSVNRPPDTDLADDLARLRLATDEVVAAERAGDTAFDLRRELARVEDRVRRRIRRTPGGAQGRQPISEAEVRERVGDRHVVQLAVVDDTLVGVLTSSRKTRQVTGAAVGEVTARVAEVSRSVSSIADAQRSSRLRQASVVALKDHLQAIDRSLRKYWEGSDDLVLVPPTEFQAFPWTLLPSLWSTSVAVAPSATAWAIGTDRRRSTSATLVVAGPGLNDARREAVAVAAKHPSATSLLGDDATCVAVRDALTRCDLAHIVSHGRFRVDSPMFSTLEMVDGGLSLYELERSGSLPDTVILSACDLGLVSSPSGGEPLGAAAAFLTAGAATVVANPAAVPDSSTTASFMEGVHSQISKWSTVREALAVARRSLDPEDPDHIPVAAFTAIGAG